MSRKAGAIAKRQRRATLSNASKRTGGGHDPLAPLNEAGDCCYWCGERRKTRLRVGRLPNIGFGTYCVQCSKDGSGKID